MLEEPRWQTPLKECEASVIHVAPYLIFGPSSSLPKFISRGVAHPFGIRTSSALPIVDIGWVSIEKPCKYSRGSRMGPKLTIKTRGQRCDHWSNIAWLGVSQRDKAPLLACDAKVRQLCLNPNASTTCIDDSFDRTLRPHGSLDVLNDASWIWWVTVNCSFRFIYDRILSVPYLILVAVSVSPVPRRIDNREVRKIAIVYIHHSIRRVPLTHSHFAYRQAKVSRQTLSLQHRPTSLVSRVSRAATYRASRLGHIWQ